MNLLDRLVGRPPPPPPTTEHVEHENHAALERAELVLDKVRRLLTDYEDAENTIRRDR